MFLVVSSTWFKIIFVMIGSPSSPSICRSVRSKIVMRCSAMDLCLHVNMCRFVSVSLLQIGHRRLLCARLLWALVGRHSWMYFVMVFRSFEGSFWRAREC